MLLTERGEMHIGHWKQLLVHLRLYQSRSSTRIGDVAVGRMG